LFTVEDQADELRRVEEAQRFMDKLPWRVTRGHDQEVAVDAAPDNPAVRERNHRRRVDQDVVVAAASLPDQVGQPRGRYELVKPTPVATGTKDGEIERWAGLDDGVQCDLGGEDSIGEARAPGAMESQAHVQRRTAEVRLDQEDARLRILGERARQVDGRR